MPRRNYKDTLFKSIYGQEKNKKWLLSLYNALSGANCTDEREIEINTIEDIIYVTRKNDVSFLIGTEMYLLEHQSSWNPNLPIRGLMYFSQLYNKRFKQKRKLVFGKRKKKVHQRFVRRKAGENSRTEILCALQRGKADARQSYTEALRLV